MAANGNGTNQINNTRALTESAIMIALATVLSLYAVFKLPNGGSVTIGSMIPILLISLRYPFHWSIAVAFAYSLVQMLTGFYAPPVENLINYILVVLLDYVVAFSVLCLIGPIYQSLGQAMPARYKLVLAASLCFLLRFVCHFLSGIIIWGVYAPEGQAVWLYSLVYNGSYMLGECVVSGLILFAAGDKLISFLRPEEHA